MTSTASHLTPISTGTLSWVEAGHGFPIVFLHGIGSAARSWSAQFEGPLAMDHRLLAWNAPGYGASSPLPAAQPVVADYAEAVLGWLAAIGVPRFHLVGHSLGALVAAHVAIITPDAIASLTLASCAVGHARRDPAQRAEMLASRIADVRDLGARGMAEKRGPRLVRPDAPEPVRRAVVETMAMVDPHGYAQAAHMLSTGDMFADLARLPQGFPLQVICGADDVITSPEINQRVAEARPGTPFTLIPQAGHAVYLEQPKQFDDALRRFIGAHDGV